MAVPSSLEEIMAPVGAGRFQDEYLGQKPLHLEGSIEKFQDVMSWDVLNRLLGTTTIWSSASLQLVLDKEPIPPAQYCSASPGRDGGTVLRPDPARVKDLLRRGATLVANDIDQLTPELRTFSRALETALGGKVQANLYLSSKRRQGFRAHFDTHDVFAAHCAGEKTWHVYEGRAEHPIAHPMFKTLGADHHEKAKGALWRAVRMKPGDLLYLPRGQYHDALADDGACMHIAFGVTYPIGLDVVSWLFERMVAEPAARANLPGEPAALQERLGQLGDRLAAILSEPRALSDVQRLMAGYRYARESYDLPGLIDEADERFAVKAGGLKLVEAGGRWGLAKVGTREAVEIPAGIKDLVAWVIARPTFARQELATAFPKEPRAKLDKLLVDLQRMRLLDPAA